MHGGLILIKKPADWPGYPSSQEDTMPDPRLRLLGQQKFSEIALSLVDHLDAMVALWDPNQVCVFANNAYQLWFGLAGKDVVGLTMKELLGPLYEENLPHILAALRGEKQEFERTIPTPHGVRHSLATYIPNVVEGRVEGFFVHVTDVTGLKMMELELKAAKEDAEHQATHDFLTGLPNRVLLVDRIEQAISLAERKDAMVAVLSLDLDDFKKVNDTYGHGEGDRVLIEVAQRVKGALREYDSVTRLGGDEFMVLLQEIGSVEEVILLAERLLERIGRIFPIGGAPWTPSSSVGIALYPRHGATPAELIAHSDRALYLAKHLGKNRYVLAESDRLDGGDRSLFE